MDAANRLLAIQIGQGAGNLENAMITARGKLQPLGGIAQQLQPGRIRLGIFFYQGRRAASVRANGGKSRRRVAFLLRKACPGDPGGHHRTRLGHHGANEIGGGDSGNVDADIDTV
ncbi:hypothetical protein D3C86_1161560 [compost metagenome]